MQKDNEVFRAPEQNLICIRSGEIPKRFWQSLKGLSQWDFAKVSWDLAASFGETSISSFPCTNSSKIRMRTISVLLHYLVGSFSSPNSWHCIPTLLNQELSQYTQLKVRIWHSSKDSSILRYSKSDMFFLCLAVNSFLTTLIVCKVVLILILLILFRHCVCLLLSWLIHPLLSFCLTCQYKSFIFECQLGRQRKLLCREKSQLPIQIVLPPDQYIESFKVGNRLQVIHYYNRLQVLKFWYNIILVGVIDKIWNYKGSNPNRIILVGLHFQPRTQVLSFKLLYDWCMLN